MDSEDNRLLSGGSRQNDHTAGWLGQTGSGCRQDM